MAVEDFTTYTVAGQGGALNVTPTLAISASLFTRNDGSYNAYAQKDKGAAFFTGDFTHNFTLDLTSTGADCIIYPWYLSNMTGEVLTSTGANSPIISVLYFQTNATFYLRDFRSSTFTDDTWVSSFATSTIYYLTVQRSGTTVTCNIYSDSGRTTLVKALTVSPGAAQAYQYVAVMGTHSDAGAIGSAQVSGYVENLDLAPSGGGGGTVLHPMSLL